VEYISCMPDKLYIVREGDWMGKIARQHNIADPDTIYNHPPNQALKDKRNEKDLLSPGDEVWIPVREELEVPTKGKNSGPVSIQATLAETEQLSVTLKNENGELLTNKDYTVNFSGQGQEITGNTGSSGKIEADLPAGTEQVFVDLGGELMMSFYLGHLDPPDTVRGASQRLRNLNCFKHDTYPNEITPDLYDALRKFQYDNEINISGQLDSETSEKITEKYGC
jgi:hypothetical protein